MSADDLQEALEPGVGRRHGPVSAFPRILRSANTGSPGRSARVSATHVSCLQSGSARTVTAPAAPERSSSCVLLTYLSRFSSLGGGPCRACRPEPGRGHRLGRLPRTEWCLCRHGPRLVLASGWPLVSSTQSWLGSLDSLMSQYRLSSVARTCLACFWASLASPSPSAPSSPTPSSLGLQPSLASVSAWSERMVIP